MDCSSLIVKLMERSAVDGWIPIITIIIAAAVAFATIGQWFVNRSKLRLDLYNRRFEIYSKTLDFFQMVLYYDPLKAIDDDRIKYKLRELDFIKSHRESQFLFSNKFKCVYQLLDEFRQKANRIVAYRELREQMRGQETPDQIKKTFDEYTKDLEWVRNFIPLLEKKMAPYLNFQKVAGVW
jgi:hypothetical protein